MTDISADEMTAMLKAGARAQGTLHARAAIHLLTFTEMVGRSSGLAELVEIRDVTLLGGGGDVRCAFIRDWPALLDSPTAQMAGGAAYRLLTLAAGFATGKPVDIREATGRMGRAHARRVIEAFAMATGLAEAAPEEWPWW
jgi:hypothetical protein